MTVDMKQAAVVVGRQMMMMMVATVEKVWHPEVVVGDGWK